MKILTTILTILCLTASLQAEAWQYQRSNNFFYDFYEGQSGWNIDIDCETYVQYASRGLEFHDTGVKEGDYVQIMSLEFYPEHYGADFKELYGNLDYEKETIMEINAGYSFNKRHRANYIYEFHVFTPPDIQINEVDEPIDRIVTEELNGYTIYLSRILEKGETIREIKIFMEIELVNPDYEFYFWFRDISINDLVRLNPEYEDRCDLYVSSDKYEYIEGDRIDFKINSFYYGFESQLVDIYLVYYNNIDLYFFPSMGGNVDKITAFMPQFTMTNSNMFLGGISIDDLSPSIGINFLAIGIAPAGTLDFLNEVVSHKINYSEE